MKIQSLSIKNFKTFDAEGANISLNDLTALVGENSTGKSNVLEALDLFFNFSKAKVQKSSFHHEDILLEISIQVIFDNLSSDEKLKFRSHLSENGETLTIMQIIKNETGSSNDEEGEPDDARTNDQDVLNIVESRHGSKWQAKSEYPWLNCYDKAPKKTDVKNWWKDELKVGEVDFKAYFSSKDEPTPDVFQEQVNKFWSDHGSAVPKEQSFGDDKVLGWKNKLKGNLPRFFLIPALRNIEDDLKSAKTTPFAQIIAFLTSEISGDLKKDLQNKTRSFLDEMIAKMAENSDGPSKLQTINAELNRNIGIDLGCNIQVQFTPPAIEDFINPKLFADDGFNSEITQKGHGMQRLALFSLLRTYYQMKDSASSRAGLIIGIEEPEIYLHPPLKRAVYALLRNLSKSGSQIAYTTHDSHFIKVESFDEVRLFRRTSNIPEKFRTTVSQYTYGDLSALYQQRHNIRPAEESLRHRFQHICDDGKNEGFFARKVILVEGDTEKYALPIYFQLKGFDLDSERVSIITAGSVDNISYLLILFRGFGIPCYVMFDGDKPIKSVETLSAEEKKDATEKSRRNKEILALIDDSQFTEDFCFPSTAVHKKYCIWEYDFEEALHKQLDVYVELKSAAKKLYGTDSKPLTARYIASRIVTDYPDRIDPRISGIITCVRELYEESPTKLN